MPESEDLPVPEAVTHLWDHVKKALSANEDPSPRRIDRLAAAAGLELAGSTIAGWFETWSVVPTWEKFEVLVKALAAEQDEDWRALHRAALAADRERKREERRSKEPGRPDTPASSPHLTANGHSDSQPPAHNGFSSTATGEWVAGSGADRHPDVPSSAHAGLASVHACNVYGDLHLHQAAAEPAPDALAVLRQLPVDVAHFTGRIGELAMLDDVLLTEENAARPTAMVIAAVAGTAGVGKTALVVHWAHRVRHRFPDGQLFVNLRGYDPGPPMTAEQALEEFLRAMGVPAERIPAGVAARAALYRSLLDGRRMLIVLDNAASAEQVRPLLPGSPTCRVVVTSRSRLSGLIAREGASRVTLDLLSPTEAIALLGDVVGAERVAAERAAAGELASRCAYLPLALRIAAERAVTRPHVTLADLAEELAVERDRLDLLAAADEEDEATAVRAVFSWSYHALPAEAARAFRLLGLHVGPDLSVPAASALLDITHGRARRWLDTLVGTNLLEETHRSRYRFHDLLRVYAAERAQAEETDQDRDAAVRRVLTWYLHTADAAGRMLNPLRRRIPLAPPEAACVPLAFTTHDQALDWCEAERANLVAVTRRAAETGEHVIAWRLPVALWDFFNLRKHWADWITTHHIGLTAAQHLRDRRGEGWIWGGLGMAYLYLRQYQEALDHYQKALPIGREIDDPWCEAIGLLGLGAAYLHLGQYEEALDYSEQGLRICQEIDDPWSHTLALIQIGGVHRKLQRFEDAIDYFQRALTVAGPVQDYAGEAQTLYSLGLTYRDLQRFEDALTYFRQAHTTHRKIRDRWGEAQALRHIGDTLQDLNQVEVAIDYWRQALPIFEDLGDSAAAEKVRAKLSPPSDPDGYQ